MVAERWPTVVVALLAAGCAVAPPEVSDQFERLPVEAQASVDRAVATTGDLITYRIEVDSEPGYEVEIPEVGASIEGFRIVDIGENEPVDRGHRVIRGRWYRLRADLVGSYVLPPVEVRYRIPTATDVAATWQSLTTSEIFVEVASVLAADSDATDIRDLKPLRRVRSRIPWGWITALGVALILALVLSILVLRRRRRGRVETPPRPAHELAFAALDDLRRTDFDDPQAVRRFYFQISEVVRAYVEGRFGMNATDLTTDEILTRLGELAELEAGPRTELDRFLVETDLVKFAHREPRPDDIEATYDRALEFVESTRSVDQGDELEAA